MAFDGTFPSARRALIVRLHIAYEPLSQKVYLQTWMLRLPKKSTNLDIKITKKKSTTSNSAITEND